MWVAICFLVLAFLAAVEGLVICRDLRGRKKNRGTKKIDINGKWWEDL